MTSNSPGSAPERMDESNSSDPFMTLSPDAATSPHLSPTYHHTKLMFTDLFRECLSLDSSDDGYQKTLVGLSNCGKSMERPMHSLFPDAPCKLVLAVHLASPRNVSADPTRYLPSFTNLAAVPRLAPTGLSDDACLTPIGVQNYLQGPKES